MPFSRGRAALLALCLALTLSLSATIPPTQDVGAVTSSGPLTAASGITSHEVITLDSLASCQIFDGLTIMKNTGKRSLRIVGVRAIIPFDRSTSSARITYQLRSFREGTTTGAVGAVANMPVLGGQVLGNAVGGVLRPISSSSNWYVVLARLSVNKPHTSEWVIRGLRIFYRAGSRMYSVELKQTVRLPRTQC
jgi:hypothetical protein